MSHAATRLAALGALTWLSAASAQTAPGAASANQTPPGAPVRAAPSRPLLAPALPTGLRVGNVDYASATDVAGKCADMAKLLGSGKAPKL